LLADIRRLARQEIDRLIKRSEAAPADKPTMTAGTVLTLLREAIRLERLIVGEATERVEERDELDLSRLSLDELRLLKDLRTKAQRD